ncbi:MAG: hypothetical protein MRK00_00150 [Nitrosomonas sp.]|nr:hypothetical protein [Nitrosomonas sp.]
MISYIVDAVFDKAILVAGVGSNQTASRLHGGIDHVTHDAKLLKPIAALSINLF